MISTQFVSVEYKQVSLEIFTHENLSSPGTHSCNHCA